MVRTLDEIIIFFLSFVIFNIAWPPMRIGILLAACIEWISRSADPKFSKRVTEIRIASSSAFLTYLIMESEGADGDAFRTFCTL
jgi:hypothetical protein